MQLVIKLPKSAYESIISGNFNTDGYFKMNLQNTFKEGKKLPKGHGRLIDVDELCKTMYRKAFETDSDMQKWDSGCWIKYKMLENSIKEMPTIIEAQEGQHE